MFVHCPVLSGPLFELLRFPPGAVVVDATIGQGGHAVELAGRLDARGLLIGLDVDATSLAAARERLAATRCRCEFVRENFARLGEVLGEMGLTQVDVILADLGVSSAQLADAGRGFSFQLPGPLDMRLDDRLERTAADLVNRLSADELAEVIWRYGQERASRRIARAIVAARQRRRLTRTDELAEAVLAALGLGGSRGRRSKIHPATRTFQALRIAVNDELGCLQGLLEAGGGLLRRGGEIAVISFHSLEDRLVKEDFRRNVQAGRYELVTRKAVRAAPEERGRNPRSRSARLRVARRTIEANG